MNRAEPTIVGEHGEPPARRRERLNGKRSRTQTYGQY